MIERSTFDLGDGLWRARRNLRATLLRPGVANAWPKSAPISRYGMTLRPNWVYPKCAGRM